MSVLTTSSGWGRYPQIATYVNFPQSFDDCQDMVIQKKQLIVRGLGRSYGDSSLAKETLDTRYLRHFQAFDETTGILTCEAGVTLRDILQVVVPQGWFLPVTPGTQFVTIGGAIASDVHGKNHHVDGAFSDHVIQIELLLGNGTRVVASPTHHSELFRATCGGMGLTGIILAATIQLKPIVSSRILETSIKLACLSDLLDAFNDYQHATYSVAWIDCLAKGRHLGRSILKIGEHAEDGYLTSLPKRVLSVPFDMPAHILNYHTIKAFNALYYGRTPQTASTRQTTYQSFFYPLDRLRHWNRLYGKSGFVQYQFLLPRDAGEQGLRDVLQRIVNSRQGSFLAVLKIFGKGNKNYLSFPAEGYSVALDFKFTPSLLTLLAELDQLILTKGGRLYLAKDARMTEHMFKSSYPRWDEFEQVRATYHAIGKFSSLQSQRLGLQ